MKRKLTLSKILPLFENHLINLRKKRTKTKKTTTTNQHKTRKKHQQKSVQYFLSVFWLLFDALLSYQYKKL